MMMKMILMRKLKWKEESGDDNDKDEENNGYIRQLKSAWKRMAPPVTEKPILGKWYAVIYESKKTKNLFIGKVLCRFLLDDNGSAESAELRCLKPKVDLEIFWKIPQLIFQTYLFFKLKMLLLVH